MISRQRCRDIAYDWQLTRGLEEYDRRCQSVFAIPHLSVERFRELQRGMAEAVLEGYYDPPLPKIPGFFARLFLDDWTPPELRWPMCTAKGPR